MARILDFYAVRWEYEPHTFPILWNLDGDVVESFSPDFYLPDLDLLPRDDDPAPEARPQEEPQAAPAPRAVPRVTVKLFYARDFRALMLKYGKLALVDALSGSSGQTAPPRGSASRERRRRAATPPTVPAAVAAAAVAAGSPAAIGRADGPLPGAHRPAEATRDDPRDRPPRATSARSC